MAWAFFSVPGMVLSSWGFSPLQAVMSGTASLWQLRYREVSWEGSRRQMSDWTNRNRIEGLCLRVREQWIPMPDTHPYGIQVNPAGADRKLCILPREICRVVCKRLPMYKVIMPRHWNDPTEVSRGHSNSLPLKGCEGLNLMVQE